MEDPCSDRANGFSFSGAVTNTSLGLGLASSRGGAGDVGDSTTEDDEPDSGAYFPSQQRKKKTLKVTAVSKAGRSRYALSDWTALYAAMK